DLVLGDPAEGLAGELEGLGAAVGGVDGIRNLSVGGSSQRLVEAAMAGFGRGGAGAAFTGGIVSGRVVRWDVSALCKVVTACVEWLYVFLRAVVPVMVEQGEGQVLLFTSAAGARVTPGAPLYSAARAGANHLMRNVAAEVAGKGVQVNAVGTNFMDFP